MQLDCWQVGWRLGCVMVVVDNVAWSLQPAEEMRSYRSLNTLFPFSIFRLVVFNWCWLKWHHVRTFIRHRTAADTKGFILLLKHMQYSHDWQGALDICWSEKSHECSGRLELTIWSSSQVFHSFNKKKYFEGSTSFGSNIFLLSCNALLPGSLHRLKKKKKNAPSLKSNRHLPGSWKLPHSAAGHTHNFSYFFVLNVCICLAEVFDLKFLQLLKCVKETLQTSKEMTLRWNLPGAKEGPWINKLFNITLSINTDNMLHTARHLGTAGVAAG